VWRCCPEDWLRQLTMVREHHQQLRPGQVWWGWHRLLIPQQVLFVPATEDDRIDEEAGGANDVMANELSVDAAALLDATGMSLVTVIRAVDTQPTVGDKDVATT
jgi:hypothetical protein